MSITMAFLLALALSAVLCLLYAKVLAPVYHLKYCDKDYTELSAFNIMLGFLICMAAFWPLCIRLADSSFNLWSILVCALLLIASAVDFYYKKIPNELVLIILATAVIISVYNTIIFDDYNYLMITLGGGITAVAPLIAAVLLFEKGVGSGDIKLIFAAGAFLGSTLAFYFFFLTFLLAFFGAIFLIIRKKAGRRSRIIMAPFMAAAFVITVYFQYFLQGINMYWWLR